MCNALLEKKTILSLVVIVMALGITGPVSAIDHWWHGGVSNNLNDPANWTDLNAGTDPTAPTGNPRDIVRIGGSWGTEDLNGNGVLDSGEDLNGNGVIDNPNPGGGVGYGGYGPAGGGVELSVNPVLRDTYVSRNDSGTAEIGWLFVLNYPNILTLKDGAFLIMSEANCNLRNGGRLEVQGRSNTGGPSLITAGSFRVAENGAVAEAAHETSQIRINGTGYMQVDASLEGSDLEKATWLRIGTSDAPGTMPRGEIIIEEDGLLELLTHEGGPYILWGNADPQANQIIIRGSGELWLSGDPANMGRIGEEPISLDDMIATGLIANDQGGTLTVTGSNPTVIKVSGVDNPSPAYGDPDVVQGVVLSWDPNPDHPTATYDVYFGTDLDSVTNATRANPMGVLVSQGQTQPLYPESDTLSLDYSQTYYWRIDAVDTEPMSGKLWYFTMEPYARVIDAETITVTASSNTVDQEPEKTIDGSGLDVNDLHSNDSLDMWLSGASEPNSAWIQYEFDIVHKLQQMLVWNFNGPSINTGLGLQNVTIETSIDGVSWNKMDATFARAPGTTGYAHNTTIEFSGTPIKMVKITAINNWGNNPLFNLYGLSEVRFLSIPVSARKPNPESGATDVAVDATLSWRTGREAVEHMVFFSTDEQAVISGTTPMETVSQVEYSPTLDLNTTYYWRVDEVNNAEVPAIWEGSVWNLTTQPYITVDDFESYTNAWNHIVFQTWTDGYGWQDPNGSSLEGNGTGSAVGYWPPPTIEDVNVYDGTQSMPLTYGIDGKAVAETTATLPSALPVNQHGIKTLSLQFYGRVANVPGQLFIKINGQNVSNYPGPQDDMKVSEWHAWTLDLAAAGITSIKTLTIGVTGGNGMIFIDAIRLYPTTE